MPENFDTGWMSGEEYDMFRAADFVQFCEAASLDLEARVPTCPEWNITTLCDHLASVYQAKAHTIELGTFMPSDDSEHRDRRVNPIEWVRSCAAILDRALWNRPDNAPTITFVPSSTTVHFWRRRMALETLVHRVDAQLAVGAVSAMNDDLSADGVDEMLWFGSERPRVDYDYRDVGRAVVLLTDGIRRWTVTMSDSELSTRSSNATPDATVRCSAPTILLVLSGRDIEGIGAQRLGLELPFIEGDPVAFRRLRKRLGTF